MRTFSPDLYRERFETLYPLKNREVVRLIVVEGYGQKTPYREEVTRLRQDLACGHIVTLILGLSLMTELGEAAFAEEVAKSVRRHGSQRQCILISESHPAFQVIKVKVSMEENVCVLSGFEGKYPREQWWWPSCRSTALVA